MKTLNNEKFIINLKTKVFVKKKITKNLNLYLSRFQNKKILIILDEYFNKNKAKKNYIFRSIKFFKYKKIYINNFYEPNFNNLETIIKLYNKNKFDLIIGIGGGSTIDIAKGLSVSLNYKKNIRNLQGKDKFTHNSIPVIAIPSIFGSGAEITPSAVFINEKTKIKGGINSEKVQPLYAFLDPYLANSKNLRQHTICAFDALVHSLESYESTISNDFTKTFAINGVIKVLSGLKLLNKNELDALELIAEGSIYSIISLMHSEQSLAGAASYPLAAYYGYNHAYCGSSFLIKSLIFFNKRRKNYLNGLLDSLHKSKLINENNISSLINELKVIKKRYKVQDIELNTNDIEFLSNKIVKMPMIKFSKVRLNKKHIKEFLENE